MSKNENGTIDFSGLDPDVAGAVDQGRQRFARRQGPAQARRAEAAKARKAAKDKARNRRMIDLPADLEQDLEKLAAQLSVPWSSLAVHLITRGLDTTTLEELEDQREPTRSMRYEFIIPYRGKKKKPAR